MARTRTTIRRIDPWSILKFGFVVNLVLLGIQLLAGTIVWYFVRRLELIESVCELAATVGFEECGVDGSALFDTFLVLGLLGVVIQTGIVVFLAFLANLIFDLTGGIVVTLEDDRGPAGATRTAGVGARSLGAGQATSRSGPPGSGSSREAGASAAGTIAPPAAPPDATRSGRDDTTQITPSTPSTPDPQATQVPFGDTTTSSTTATPSDSGGSSGSSRPEDDEKLFGSS